MVLVNMDFNRGLLVTCFSMKMDACGMARINPEGFCRELQDIAVEEILRVTLIKPAKKEAWDVGMKILSPQNTPFHN